MAKEKFRFNPATLSYDRVTTTFREKIIRTGKMFAASIVISVVYYAVYSRIYDTPKERVLINQLEDIKFNYQKLSQNLDHIDDVLSDIQKRDDNIYRTVLETDPIPASVRQAGFGGVNRYESLEGYLNSDLMIAVTKHTDKIYRQLYVQTKSYDELIPKALSKEQMALSRPAILPVSTKKFRNISAFGMRRNPVLGVYMMHTGMDFSADIGTNIYATGDGTIVKTEYNGGGYGKMVIIDHGFGVQTRYAHMSSFAVLEGNEVKRGDIIGAVGNTGRSAGPHLHYEVLKNGVQVNPITYFYNDLSPDQYVQMHEESQKNDILEIW